MMIKPPAASSRPNTRPPSPTTERRLLTRATPLRSHYSGDPERWCAALISVAHRTQHSGAQHTGMRRSGVQHTGMRRSGAGGSVEPMPHPLIEQ